MTITTKYVCSRRIFVKTIYMVSKSVSLMYIVQCMDRKCKENSSLMYNACMIPVRMFPVYRGHVIAKCTKSVFPTSNVCIKNVSYKQCDSTVYDVQGVFLGHTLLLFMAGQPGGPKAAFECSSFSSSSSCWGLSYLCILAFSLFL